MKLCNISHNLTPHVYQLYGTQHHKTSALLQRQVLSPTRCWRPLPHCPPRAFDIFHITVWFLCACIVFIRKLAFKSGDTIFRCRPLKIHLGQQHSYHSAQTLLLWWMEYFHHRHCRSSYRGECMRCDIDWGKYFTGTSVCTLFGGTIHTRVIL